jgi:hypothetical protein
MSKYYIHKNKNKCRKKDYRNIIIVFFLITLLMIPLSEPIFQTISAANNDVFSENIKIVKTYINENTSKTNLFPVTDSEIIEPDSSQSPIRKYFTTQKILWTFDDYYISDDYYPPHKGFGGLAEQINSFGGYVGINCIFIPHWIEQKYGSEVRNYSVIPEFSKYTSEFSQAHIDKSLEFFNMSHIEPEAHGWNHTENLDTCTLSYAYNIINYTLWNWYNNYHIKPSIWLGHNTDGNYNISLALKKFNEKYWTVYAEDLRVDDKTLFPNHIAAVEYIGTFFDPLFGCDWGTPCKTAQEAEQRFTTFSQGKEIVPIRGHPYFLNGTDQHTTENLTKWQTFIDWVYQTHTYININHTEAIQYKIDRDNFIIEKNSSELYIIDLTDCMFDHNVLFTNPDGTNKRNWTLCDKNGKYIGVVRDDVFLELKNGVKYLLSTNETAPEPNTSPNTPSSPSPTNGATNISLNTQLKWVGGDPDRDAVTYDIYFGTTSSPPKVKNNQSTLSYAPTLTYNTTYYWKVGAWDSNGAHTTGPLWSFITISLSPNNPPKTPNNPSPSNGANLVNITTDFSWAGGDQNSGNTVTYTIYFGTTNPPTTKVSNNQSATTYNLPTLTYSTQYYWKIIAWDNHGASTVGPIWRFTTESKPSIPPNTPSNPSPKNGTTNVLLNAILSWVGGDSDVNSVTYDIYFGPTSSPPKVKSNQSTLNYNPGILTYNTIYYWKIIVWDFNTYIVGPLWHFTTATGRNGGGGREQPVESENKKPIANISAEELYHGLVNSIILFNGSKSYDPDGNITKWLWVFGDNTNGTGKTILHSYLKAGTYTVTLNVTDNEGATNTETTTCMITQPNRPPTKPIITGPINGTKNTKYTYIALSTDADNNTIQYTFDWGDSLSQSSGFLTNGTSFTVNHSWIAAGRYNVTVTVTDNKTTSYSKITVCIDAEQTGDIGYLLDNNGDGIYDTFYSNISKQTTTVQKKDGTYNIDSNGDGTWDYTFDAIKGLTSYQEPPKKPGYEFIIVIGAMALVFIWERKSEKKIGSKKNNLRGKEKSTKKSKNTRTKKKRKRKTKKTKKKTRRKTKKQGKKGKEKRKKERR